MAKSELEAFATKYGITMAAKFIPLSKSRNAGKWRSLNWSVTLERSGKPFLTTDYSAGEGNAPSRQGAGGFGSISIDQKVAIDGELETGFRYRLGAGGAVRTMEAILPSLADVLYSLSMDSDAIDYPNFEDWASSLGYDSDSREAEGIYRSCLQIALSLRAALGEEGLRELQEAAQDY